MSLFLCHSCDNLRDSDEGCDTTPDGMPLICAECMDSWPGDDDAEPANDD